MLVFSAEETRKIGKLRHCCWTRWVPPLTCEAAGCAGFSGTGACLWRRGASGEPPARPPEGSPCRPVRRQKACTHPEQTLGRGDSEAPQRQVYQLPCRVADDRGDLPAGSRRSPGTSGVQKLSGEQKGARGSGTTLRGRRLTVAAPSS